MTPHYYANEFKRYATYLRSGGGDFLFKIACGANRDDYDWTEKFFAAVSGRMDGRPSLLHQVAGFAIHYYCGRAGATTAFTDDEWYELLDKALYMEPLILRHRAIMDEYDPGRSVKLIVDEWGAWHLPMEGTNLRWLKQQNTMRDALVAALTLDIFNRHADIIFMTNIAQAVNVLQALILTNGPTMVRTPTYWVYHMYRVHQGAQGIPLEIDSPETTYVPSRDVPEVRGAVPCVEGSCSRNGKALAITLVNTSATEAAEVSLGFSGDRAPVLEKWTLLADPDLRAHNTWETPDRVVPRGCSIDPDASSVTLPPGSVSLLQYRLA
jgi:alpha-N-arabinofuranosidase